MVINATFSNLSVISWRSVLFLLVEETGVCGENHQPVTSHWQTLSHNVLSIHLAMIGVRTHNFSGDRQQPCDHDHCGPTNEWTDLFHINYITSATIFLLTIKDLCFFELWIICLSWLWFRLKRKHCWCITFICFTPQVLSHALNKSKASRQICTDTYWYLTLMSYQVPWLMLCTKVTFERFLKLIQGTDMVDPTLKKF